MPILLVEGVNITIEGPTKWMRLCDTKSIGGLKLVEFKPVEEDIVQSWIMTKFLSLVELNIIKFVMAIIQRWERKLS